VELLKIPDWTDVVHADDLCFCPNLFEIIAGLRREIGGFRNSRKFERIELSFRSAEVVGKWDFSSDEDECHVFIAEDASWL
jgi:hypothetical protein